MEHHRLTYLLSMTFHKDYEQDINIGNANNFTTKNATTPAVVIDPKTGIVYAIYFRGENSGSNIYFMDD
jgi:hypothetical protein